MGEDGWGRVYFWGLAMGKIAVNITVFFKSQSIDQP